MGSVSNPKEVEKLSRTELIRKITSRKFLSLVTALIISVGTLLGTDQELIVKIIALVGSLLACIGYIWAEAYVDSKAVQVKKE